MSNAIKVVVSGNNPITIKTIPVLSPKVTIPGIGELSDVDASQEVEDATLIYHANTGKYVVEKLNIEEIVGLDVVDGGEFFKDPFPLNIPRSIIRRNILCRKSMVLFIFGSIENIRGII